MNTPSEPRLISLEDIWASKAARARRLAVLPIAEKVKIIEKLHDFALLMRETQRKRRAAPP